VDGAGSSAAVRGGLSETVTPVVRKNIVDRDVFDVDWIYYFGGCVRVLGSQVRVSSKVRYVLYYRHAARFE